MKVGGHVRLGAQCDRIDLSAIDAIGGNAFLIADTNGDGVADLWLRLDGVVTVGVGDLGL